ncbi:MAG: hypothetical protein V7784_23780 [Oceanospirillaceae bacterium]
MEIVQKKKSIKHTFAFNDENFNFKYEDKSGSGDTDFDYANFPQKSSIQIEENEWLRNAGYLWCALGVFQLGNAIYHTESISGKGLWLLIGLICITWAYFSKVKYSVFKAEHGNIFVIQGKNHDKIIEELNSRRKAQILRWYGEVDPENKLEDEIGKFKWLTEEAVMTKEEAEIKIAQAELLHKQNFDLPGEYLN